jgi:hypothetical protein
MKTKTTKMLSIIFILALQNILSSQYSLQVYDFGARERGHFSARINNTDYITIGYEGSFGSEFALISRIREGNQLVWSRAINNDGYNDKTNFALTANGDILIPGTKRNPNTQDDVNLVLIDQNGKLIWEKNFEVSGYQSSTQIFPIKNNQFIVVTLNERSALMVPDSLVLLCIDQDGHKLWSREITPPNDAFGWAASMIQDEKTEEIYFLWNYFNGVAEDIGVLTKLDSKHNIKWSKEYFESQRNIWLTGLCFSKSKKIMICGSFDRNSIVQSVDTSGYLIWRKEMSANADLEWLSDIAMLPNNKIISLGTVIPSDLLMVEIDENGDNLIHSTLKDGLIYSINSWSTNDLIATGISINDKDEQDILIISKIESILTSAKEADKSEDSNYFVTPNPYSDDLILSPALAKEFSAVRAFQIIDPKGQLVIQTKLDSKGLLNSLKELTNGLYMLNFRNDRDIEQAIRVVKVSK